MKKTNYLFILILNIFLCSCDGELTITDKNKQINKQQEPETKSEEAQIDKNKIEKIIKTNRFKVYWSWTEPENFETYRLTIEDLEQEKIVFSQEYKNTNTNINKNNFLEIKVFDSLVFITENINSTNKKYFVINPENGKQINLNCPDFKSENFIIQNFNEINYECFDPETSKKQIVDLPLEQLEINVNNIKAKNNTNNNENNENTEFPKQIKKLNEITVSLSPYEEAKQITFMGKRANLKVLKNNQLIYEKNFSGKCTGCKLINQDNWQESFRIEQILEDKILLTQILTELNDKQQKTETEPFYSSLLIIPSKNKTIHLDCGEKATDFSFVYKLDSDYFYCKNLKSNNSQEEIKKLLPKI